MKRLLLLILSVLCTICVFGLFSCTKESTKLDGAYVYIKEGDYMDIEYKLEFTDDECEYSIMGIVKNHIYTGKYEIDGDKIRFDYNDAGRDVMIPYAFELGEDYIIVDGIKYLKSSD